MNISPNSNTNMENPNPGNTGPSDDGMRSSDFTGAPVPDYQQQKFQEQMNFYQSGIQMVPNMTIPQWLLVHLLLWIPIVNIVMLIIWAVGTVGTGKDALVNFSRASLIWMAIEVGISIVLVFAFWNLISWMVMTGFNTSGYPVYYHTSP